MNTITGNDSGLVRGCPWCKKRIGAPSFFLFGQWQPVMVMELHSEVIQPDERNVTHGICPECKPWFQASIQQQLKAAA